MHSRLAYFNMLNTDDHPKIRVCRDCNSRHIEPRVNPVTGKMSSWCYRCQALTGSKLDYPVPWAISETHQVEPIFDVPFGSDSSIIANGNFIGDIWRNWTANKFTGGDRIIYRRIIVNRVIKNLNRKTIDKAKETIQKHGNHASGDPILGAVQIIVCDSVGGLRINRAKLAEYFGVTRQAFSIQKHCTPSLRVLIDEIEGILTGWEDLPTDK